LKTLRTLRAADGNLDVRNYFLDVDVILISGVYINLILNVIELG
jgi:hypothetical protein